MSRLLALDQSSKTSGYAIFIDGVLKDYGKFSFDDADVGVRLQKIRNKVKSLIEINSIDEVVFEDIQLQENRVNNVKTFKVLAEVFGIVYELVTEMDIKNSAVLASSWKSTLKIKGKDRAEQKRNAQKFVQETYGVKPTQDECDAICIGCHVLKTIDLVFDWS